MIPQRYKIFLWTGLLLALSWCSVAFLDAHTAGGLKQILAIGYLIGSLFGHATLAAVWAVLGPGPMVWRLPLSLAWIFMLGMAMAINVTFYGGRLEGAVILGFCFLTQWTVLQGPLWAMKVGLQTHLRYSGDVASIIDRREVQFGVRQLLIITTIVACLFGIGRVLAGTLLARSDLIADREVFVFLFLACSAIFFSLPLCLAALLRRHAVAGIFVALLLISVGTLVEAPLVVSISGGGQQRPNIWDLFAVNGFTSALILVVAATVRFNGYSLTRSGPENPATSEAASLSPGTFII